MPTAKPLARALLFALGALAFTLACRGDAQADPITLTLRTGGSRFIEGSITPTTTTAGGLTFTANTTTFTTESGGPPIPITLGTVTLTSAAFDYNDTDFIPTIQLLLPAISGPAAGIMPLADLTGSVGPGGGTVVFNFHRPGDPNTAPAVFNFSLGQTSGSFVLDITDLVIQSSGTGTVTATLNGVISNIQFGPRPIPEPATLLLLGAGLTGTAAAVRRRRKS